MQYTGTELMVRKLLADRLFLTKEEQKPKDGSPPLITWLTDMTIILRLTMDKSVQSKQHKGIIIRSASGQKRTLDKKGNVHAGKESGHAFTVEIELKNIPNKKDVGDRLNCKIMLCNNNGAFTKWHMKEAAAWFKRAMPKVEYVAQIEVLDGVDISSAWGAQRKSKVDRDFFYVSASQLNQDAANKLEQSDMMKKYNLLRSSMYAIWSKNLKAAAFTYDQVRTEAVV